MRSFFQNKFNPFIFRFRTAFFLILGLSIFLFFKVYFSEISYKGPCGPISNYQVFQYAHFHLLSDHDLYSYHVDEHCYTYKYSPAFALIFGAFAWLPNWLGLLLWTLLSATLSLLAIQSLPGFSHKNKVLFVCFIFFEYWVSVQSLQTNVIIASLLILSWTRLEKNQHWLASLLVVICGFIKIFGFGAFVLFLFYPKKFKLIGYSFLWTLVFFFLPMVVVPWADLVDIYDHWMNQITHDYGNFVGMSIYSNVQTITGFSLPKLWVMVISLAIMLISFLQVGKWKNPRYKLLSLACLMIWFVAFNHKAESATYVIAMFGIGLWYYSRPRKWFDHIICFIAFMGISFMFSDLVPKYVKNDIGFKYHFKALPSFIIWIRIIFELWIDTFKIKYPQQAITKE